MLFIFYSVDGMSINIYRIMNIDVACAQYISAESDEQKTCLKKENMFYIFSCCFMMYHIFKKNRK